MLDNFQDDALSRHYCVKEHFAERDITVIAQKGLSAISGTNNVFKFIYLGTCLTMIRF